MEKFGFKSKSDRQLIPILKFLNFVDSSQQPMDNWKNFRDKENGPRLLAEILKESYLELFSLFPEAQNKNTDALVNFFRTRTNVGEKAMQATVGTFKALCELANFEDEFQDLTTTSIETKKVIKTDVIQPLLPNSPSLNINIQIQLPMTDNEEIYDNLFSSLRKYLLTHIEKH